MSGKWPGGKGDRRRKGANDKKYREGWDKIFNQKTKDNKDKNK